MSNEKIIETAVRKNSNLLNLLKLLEQLQIPNACVTAGAVKQTVLNYLHKDKITKNIKDYDVFYFDDKDLSFEAEDKVISFIKTNLKINGLNMPLDIKNQARVHIWAKEKFGVSDLPYKNIFESLQSFSATISAIGIYLDDDKLKIIAPYGTDDIINGIIRPTHFGHFADSRFDAKAKSWLERFPYLKVEK